MTCHDQVVPRYGGGTANAELDAEPYAELDAELHTEPDAEHGAEPDAKPHSEPHAEPAGARGRDLEVD